MGLIKEPLEIDFYVEPDSLTDEERALISQYILQYKTKQKRKIISTSQPAKQESERPRPRV
jgi:hypothetical protein